MAGIRDVIIHSYFGVDLNVIWKTANERLPELKMDIEKILRNDKNLISSIYVPILSLMAIWEMGL